MGQPRLVARLGAGFFPAIQAAQVAETLIAMPPKHFLVNGDGGVEFDAQPAAIETTSDLIRATWRVRNNLFHGNKLFPANCERDERLMTNALAVIDMILQALPDLSSAFQEPQQIFLKSCFHIYLEQQIVGSDPKSNLQMNLQEFKAAVDACPDEITPKLERLEALYEYVGLPIESSFSRNAAAQELYRKIVLAFSAGRQTVWKCCRNLLEELIQDHVLDGKPVDPYFEVLERLRDAVRAEGATTGDIEGDWTTAIRHAFDHARISNWDTSATRENTHTRAFELARAARRLRDAGCKLLRSGHYLSLAPESETLVVERLEAAIAQIGGLNVARRSFARITPLYREVFERYDLVKRPSMMGGGQPLIPFGYILMLAAKHFIGKKPNQDTDANWASMLRLANDYAAVFDVQEYAPSVWRSMDAAALIVYLREVAQFDMLFRLPQIRASDIEAIVRGILRDLDFNKKRGGGWSLNELLTIVKVMLDGSKAKRGPHWFDADKILAGQSGLDLSTVTAALNEVFSHPKTGANPNFAKPTDAPTDDPHGRELGHNFYTRPLLTADEETYWLLDRSMCSTSCFEAILGAARSTEQKLDQKLGATIEAFMRETLHSHKIPTVSGDYDVDGEHGECDIVVETDEVIVFFEIKKKPFTRRAQAGSDAHILLDLAESLVAAQAQAGWHEVRLRKHGYVDLDAKGQKYRLELKDRHIERIAVSLLPYGSFQDRIFLKQLLEGTMNVSFTSPAPLVDKKMAALNASLGELREQFATLYLGLTQVRMPFFHCWFLSVPQLLALLDGVTGPAEFKKALWQTRSLATGTADFYYDLAFVRG
jgi:Holliday junction resolvase-like predicted endonuclease